MPFGMETSHNACDPTRCLLVSFSCVAAWTMTLLLSRFYFSAWIAPKTYPKLDAPARAYWDISIPATANGAFNSLYCILIWMREPRLLPWRATTDDVWFQSDDTCSLIVIFMTWCAYDLSTVVYYWREWDRPYAMILHHASGIVAWALYLEGGYGHAMSLVGVFCEVTNPFMNIRYFLSTCQLKHSRAYIINGVGFCIAWLLVRILFAIPACAWLISLHWAHLRPSMQSWRLALYVAFYLVGASLNCVWGYKLFHGAYKLLSAKKA